MLFKSPLLHSVRPIQSEVIKALQRKREADELSDLRDLAERFTGSSVINDPATHDEELQQKLARNDSEARKVRVIFCYD